MRLLPTPVAGDTAPERHGPHRRHPPVRDQAAGRPDRRHRRLPRSRCHRPAEGVLLPTPDTGTSPRGHGRRGGRPGNGHQSGASIDAAARDAARPGSRWSEYLPGDPPLGTGPRLPRPAARPARPRRPALAVSRVRRVDDGHPRPGHHGCPASPGPTSCRSSATASSRSRRAAALRLLIDAAAIPAPHAAGTGARRMKRPCPRASAPRAAGASRPRSSRAGVSGRSAPGRTAARPRGGCPRQDQGGELPPRLAPVAVTPHHALRAGRLPCAGAAPCTSSSPHVVVRCHPTRGCWRNRKVPSVMHILLLHVLATRRPR